MRTPPIAKGNKSSYSPFSQSRSEEIVSEALEGYVRHSEDES